MRYARHVAQRGDTTPEVSVSGFCACATALWFRFVDFIDPLTAAITCTLFLQDCTPHLAEGQKRERAIYEEKGLLVKEKRVGTAAVLGIFPGAGYFCTHS